MGWLHPPTPRRDRMTRQLSTALTLLLLATAIRAQAPATACKDGTTSAVTGKGACSHHGGVEKKATTKKADRAATGGPITYQPRTAAPSPAPTPTPPLTPMSVPTRSGDPLPVPRPTAPRTTSAVPTGASAQCKDGSYSHSKNRRGTCSHHGGVSAWMGLAK